MLCRRAWTTVRQCTQWRRAFSSAIEYLPQSPASGDKIFLGMSGGVDSAVAAAILSKKHGTDSIQAFYMANFDPSVLTPLSEIEKRLPWDRKPNLRWKEKNVPPLSEKKSEKCIEKEFAQVTAICEHLRLSPPLFLNFEKEYWAEVFQPMIESYAMGFTPNPDVDCNRAIKFGCLIPALERKAAEVARGGKWWMATGHYAKIVVPKDSNGEPHLLSSIDRVKDQTFFLATIRAESLRHTLFPIGDLELTKRQVQAMAQELKLPGWDGGKLVKESMGLCFVEPGRSFTSLLEEFIPDSPGDVIAGPGAAEDGAMAIPQGTLMGRHRGLWSLTIGSRSKMNLPQGNPAFRGKWYISRKYPETNEIEIVKGVNHPRLYSRGLRIEPAHWLGSDCERVSTSSNDLVMKFRHQQEPFPVSKVFRRGAEVVVEFENPQWGVCPGQAAVLWQGRRCLGGGRIIDGIE